MEIPPFHTRPLHIKKDMQASINVNSERIEVSAEQLVEHMEKRDIDRIIKYNAYNLNIPAKMLLELSEAPYKVSTDRSRLLWPVMFLLGVITTVLFTLVFTAFRADGMLAAFMFASSLMMVLGLMVGWVGHAKEQERKKEIAQTIKGWADGIARSLTSE